jgi:DNA invertase Pin-like site-specific DNA recombinase
MQTEAIARVARRDVTWYADVVTGATLARPELDRLRSAVKQGFHDVVYVYRLDRLTRSGIRDTLDLIEEFRRGGCQLVSIADGFDFQGPTAEVVLAVLAWGARMERLAIRERISSARERVRAKGGAWGRPRRMTDEQRRRANVLFDCGHSVRQIAMLLKVPRATVGRCLKK